MAHSPHSDSQNAGSTPPTATGASDPAGPKGTSAGLEKARRDKLARLQAMGIDPWGSRFDGALAIVEVRQQGEAIAPPPGQPAPDDGPQVRVAGRIMLLRSAGSLVFLSLADRGGRIQIMLGKKQVGPEVWPIVDCLDLGDVVGIDGRLGHSKTGEMTIFASQLTFLTK